MGTAAEQTLQSWEQLVLRQKVSDFEGPDLFYILTKKKLHETICILNIADRLLIILFLLHFLEK